MSLSIIASNTWRNPATASGPVWRKAARIRSLCAFDKFTFQGLTCLGQTQVPFPFVAGAHFAFYKTIFDQGAQNTIEGLLGDAQDRQKVVHRGARRAVDEVDGAVMGAAISLFGQDTVGIGGKAAIGKEHRLDPLSQLFVCQKEKRLAA